MTELSDGAIFIRPLRAEDIPAEYEAVCESIPEVSAWMGWCHPGYTIEETTAFICSREEAWKNDTDYGFGVFEVGTGKFLGGVGLNFINRVHNCATLATGSGRVARGAASLPLPHGWRHASAWNNSDFNALKSSRRSETSPARVRQRRQEPCAKASYASACWSTISRRMLSYTRSWPKILVASKLI